MAIEHDENWLGNCDIETHDMEAIDQAIDFARNYHEHMMRWRPLTEIPENGEQVQIIGKIKMIPTGEEKTVSHIKEFNHTSMFDAPDIEYLGWRPVPLGETPTAVKENID